MVQIAPDSKGSNQFACPKDSFGTLPAFGDSDIPHLQARVAVVILPIEPSPDLFGTNRDCYKVGLDRKNKLNVTSKQRTYENSPFNKHWEQSHSNRRNTPCRGGKFTRAIHQRGLAIDY